MRYLVAACAALMLIPASAQAAPQDKQDRIAAHGYPMCKTWKCAAHVKARRARKAKLMLRSEMLRYKASPMPYCTWGPESGVGNPEWSMTRYRMPNMAGGTGGGKFQILDQTWNGFGGSAYAAHAHWAAPVYQERVARRVLSGQGLDAWVNC